MDLELGTRRARAAALLTMALPGCVYVYQGDELGLWEVEDIPEHLIQDPAFHGTAGADPGRDGCRVPLPWEGDEAPFGFSPDDATTDPWLPQPPAWKDHTVAAQTGDPDSTLELYRTALHVRRAEPALGGEELTWLDAGEDVLAFTRPGGFTCVVNFSKRAVDLPEHHELLLASGPLDHGRLPSATAAWLR